MFTGIVEELGRVEGLEGPRLRVRCRTAAQDSPVGASVAVNGVCLTVVGGDQDSLAFDLSQETLDRTALRRLEPGDPVNLERPVTLMARLGGHLVQGHVDGVATVVSVIAQEGGSTITLEAPEELGRYLVEKGSVTVDGVSLTVAAVEGSTFSVALIPHTLAVTTLGTAGAGDPVNLEVDVLAKYVERLLGQPVDQERER
ncbi:MAG: riboflavin synthase [Actinomycetota bacterium]